MASVSGEAIRRPGRLRKRRATGARTPSASIEQSEVIGRMADEGDIVGQLRLGRLEEGGREQAGEGDQHDALPDPAERRRAQVLDARLAGGAKGRDRDQKREHGQEPDHQRKDDVDDEALVEEIDRPERRFLHAGHA